MRKVRTTIMLDAEVLKSAKHRAVEHGVSLSQLIEDALSSRGSKDEKLIGFVDWALGAGTQSSNGEPLTREQANERG